MLAFRPFVAEDLARLALQPAQAHFGGELLRPGYAASLAIPRLAWTALWGDAIAGCAGVVPQWAGRAVAWALVGAALPRGAWLRVTRRALVVLETAHLAGWRRIETPVDPAFGAACAWVRLLGFEAEGLMRRYAPDGRDMILTARVR